MRDTLPSTVTLNPALPIVIVTFQVPSFLKKERYLLLISCSRTTLIVALILQSIR